MNTAWWVKSDDLDARQKGVIDLPLDEPHIILGPPGSGKTNLLLLRASQMVRSGKPDVLVLVFTRTLREFIASGGGQYAFSAEKIRTLNSWTFEFLRGQGIAPAIDKNFDSQRSKRLEQIKNAIAHKALGAMHDAIVLDEAQDYLPGEMDIFFKLGRVVFAAADSRQKIYVTGDSKAGDLETRFGKNVYSLKYHYRNGLKICQIADELAKSWEGFAPLTPTSNYDEKKNPSSVEIHQCQDLATQVKKVVESLTLQMKAYPDEHLGVLCPTRSGLKAVSQQLQTTPLSGLTVLQSAEEGYVQFEQGKPICVCTIHGAKGLEFRAAHILDAENINKSPLNRHIAYTAITRAKTSLSILHSKPLPAYIESALNIARPPVKPAKLEQLFGGA